MESLRDGDIATATVDGGVGQITVVEHLIVVEMLLEVLMMLSMVLLHMSCRHHCRHHDVIRAAAVRRDIVSEGGKGLGKTHVLSASTLATSHHAVVIVIFAHHAG